MPQLRGIEPSTRATVCGECGEPLVSKPKTIRCRHCRSKASSNLVICPSCGRELHPAPSRWLIWGAPALLIVLFLFVIFRRTGSSPFGWINDRFDQGMALITDVSRQMDPQLSLEMTPIVEEVAAPSGDGDTLLITAANAQNSEKARGSTS